MKMKKIIIIVTGVIVLLYRSCVSLQDREITIIEQAQVQVLGQVEAEFNSYQFMHIIAKKRIGQKAYIELMREARKKYEGNIEIRNISITGGWSWLQLLNILGYVAGG